MLEEWNIRRMLKRHHMNNASKAYRGIHPVEKEIIHNDLAYLKERTDEEKIFLFSHFAGVHLDKEKVALLGKETYALKKRILKSLDYICLKERTDEEKIFLFSHFAGVHLDKEKVALLGKETYALKKRILKSLDYICLKDVYNKMGENFKLYADERLVSIFARLYFFEKKPSLLPILKTISELNDLVEIDKETVKINASREREILNLSQLTITKIDEMIKAGDISENVRGYKEVLFYDNEDLMCLAHFMEERKRAHKPIIISQTFYQELQHALKGPVKNRKPYLLSCFQNSDCLEYTLSNHMENGDMEKLGERLEADPVVVRTFLDEQSQEGKALHHDFLFEDGFLKMEKHLQEKILAELKTEDNTIFSLRSKALLTPGLKEALDRSDDVTHWFQYLETEDAALLEERIKLWTPLFYEQDLAIQQEQMAFIMGAETAPLAGERRKLCGLEGFMEDPMHAAIMKRMEQVSNINQAVRLIGQVTFSILPEEDETIRETLFTHLPGDTKEVVLDGLIISIPDFLYVKKQVTEKGVVCEGNEGIKMLIKKA